MAKSESHELRSHIVKIVKLPSLHQLEQEPDFAFVTSLLDGRKWTPSDGVPAFAEGEEVEVVLKEFDHPPTTQEVIEWGKANGGLILADHVVGVSFALGEATKGIQRQFPVVCLGSSAVAGLGSRCVLVLDGDSGWRYLFGNWFDDRWHGVCRFLFVRPRKAST